MYSLSLSIFSFVVFFFFKQKTAYEMRISDWSSDVCSSDLDAVAHQVERGRRLPHFGRALEAEIAGLAPLAEIIDGGGQPADRPHLIAHEHGRDRSEARRVGNVCVSTCRSRWSR